MSVLTDKEIGDLVTSTLDDLGRGSFEQIATDLTEHEAMSRILKRDKVAFQSGTGIQWTVMVKDSGNAKNIGMFQEDATDVQDVLKQASVPWRHTVTSWAFDRRELLMNRGAAEIVDLLRVRRADGMISLSKLMEKNFWSKPADSTDETEPFGVPYWLVKNATEGFNGGNPAGFSSGAGNLSSSTYPKWSNWSAKYVNFSKADLIRKLRKGHRNIMFKSPVSIPDFRRGAGQKYRLYTNESVIAAIEDLGEAQNENLGRDIASLDGTMVFKGNPIIRVPYLDPDTTNPIYMLNFGWFYPTFLRGDWLRESGVKQKANQHNTFCVFIDCTWNICMRNRRYHAVFYQ